LKRCHINTIWDYKKLSFAFDKLKQAYNLKSEKKNGEKKNGEKKNGEKNEPIVFLERRSQI